MRDNQGAGGGEANDAARGKALAKFFKKLVDDPALFAEYSTSKAKAREVMQKAEHNLDPATIDLVLNGELKEIEKLIKKGHPGDTVICGTIVRT